MVRRTAKPSVRFAEMCQGALIEPLGVGLATFRQADDALPAASGHRVRRERKPKRSARPLERHTHRLGGFRLENLRPQVRRYWHFFPSSFSAKRRLRRPSGAILALASALRRRG